MDRRRLVSETATTLKLGGYRLDMLRGELLLADGAHAPLRPQALAVLLALAEQAGHVVCKDALMRRVWPGKMVTDDSLVQAVADIRRLFGAAADDHLRTVPRRGYLLLASPPPVAPAPGNAPLFGRHEDLAELLARLGAHALVTLVGPPGVGKTRLAQAVVQGSLGPWRDGVVVVDLAATQLPADVGNAIRQALGVVSLEPEALASTWATALAGRQLLLVLDNCEHLREAVAASVRPMLSQAPQLKLLATSQVPLRLPGEECLRLAPLPVPESDDDLAQARDCAAIGLLEARVRALNPMFRLDDPHTLLAAVDICRQLDGLPLAIELAAVRVPLLGVQGVKDRLAERFRLLRASPARAGERHHTLRDAFEWSHSLLDGPEQRLFRRLGVFNGGFSLALAQAVARDADNDDWRVLEVLGSLTEKSLVVLDPAEPPRFRLLDSARAYALDRLHAAGEFDALHRQHASEMLALVMAANQARKEGRQTMDANTSGVRLELGNLRSAIAWAMSPQGDNAMATMMVAAAWPAMLFHGLNSECLRWMLALEAHLDERTPPPLAGFFLLGLGKLALRSGVPPARRHAALQRAEVLFRSLGETEFHLASLQALTQSACQQGDTTTALARVREARSLIGPGHAAAYHADLAIWEAMALAIEGRLAEAMACYEQALAHCRADGDEEFLFLVLTELAELELMLGLVDASVLRWRSLLAPARARRLHSHVMGPLLINLCGALTAQGNLTEAQLVGVEALHHLTLLGIAREGCHFHASLAARQGRHADAARLVGAGDAWRRQVGEVRLLNEPDARENALLLLAQACSVREVEVWRLEGETLDDTTLASLIQPVRSASMVGGAG